MEFFATWVATAVATGAAVWLVPGIEAVGGRWEGVAAMALALALVNAIVKPVAQLLSLPVTILTLGIFSLVVNALLLELASYLSLNVFGAGVRVSGFWAALLGAIVISIVSSLVGNAISGS